MMMRAAVLGLALTAGGAAAWLSTQPGAPVATPVAAETGEPQPAVLTQDVLVAATDIPPGSLLGQGSLRWQAWPQDALNGSFILRAARPDAPEALADLIARHGLVAGEPVSDAKLSQGGAGVLSLMLEPGRRAVAVRISAENTAGGFILPDDRVDVLHTTTRPDSAGQTDAVSRVLLSNVRVLAIDQMIDGANGAIVGKTATLELGVDEAAVVTAAEASGTVSLALRAVADNGEEPPPAARQSGTVRIIRAGQQETVEIN